MSLRAVGSGHQAPVSHDPKTFGDKLTSLASCDGITSMVTSRSRRVGAILMDVSKVWASVLLSIYQSK